MEEALTVVVAKLPWESLLFWLTHIFAHLISLIVGQVSDVLRRYLMMRFTGKTYILGDGFSNSCARVTTERGTTTRVG